MATFAKRLLQARKTSGMTQEQLGFAVGVLKQAESDWENRRQIPNPSVWPQLRATLGVSLDHLICGDRLAENSAQGGVGIAAHAESAESRAALSRRVRRLLEYAVKLDKADPDKLRALLKVLGIKAS